MHDVTDPWTEIRRPAPECVLVNGVELRAGSRVRLHPADGRDSFDWALADRVAIVEGVDESLGGSCLVAVTLEDDPARDLGESRFLGHRFYFTPGELEPIDPSGAGPSSERLVRVLVAGIGNIFLGDDGFGVAVARRLAATPRPPGVDAVDFGIRGMDLAYVLQKPYDAVVLVDAVLRGNAPGTLYVIDASAASPGDQPVVLDTHGMDPVKVLALARTLGRVPPRALVVGCEPSRVLTDDRWDEARMELSEPVHAAVEGAMCLIEELVKELVAEFRSGGLDRARMQITLPTGTDGPYQRGDTNDGPEPEDIRE